MDPKGAAKSKHASRQHHKNQHNHHHTNRKTTTQPNKPDDESLKTNQQHRRLPPENELPTNWDRYRDEEEEENQPASGASSSKASNVEEECTVEPKSKGADFSFLLSQGRNQPVENFPSFGESILPDLFQGRRSLIAAREKAFLDREEETFVVEENAPFGFEESLFSLDLNALAAQLSKLDVSKRLFIEEDILPPEMQSKNFNQLNSDPKDIKASTTIDVTIPYPTHQHVGKVVAQTSKTDYHPSESSVIKEYGSGLKQTQKLPHQTEPSDFVKTLNEQNDIPVQLDVGQLSDGKLSSRKFMAAAAEAELDMLLDSLSDTKLFESSDLIAKSTSVNSCAGTSTDQVASVTSTSLPSGSFRGSHDSDGLPSDVTMSLVNLNVSNVPPQLKSSPTNMKKADVDAGTLPSSNGPSLSLDDFDEWLDSL